MTARWLIALALLAAGCGGGSSGQPGEVPTQTPEPTATVPQAPATASATAAATATLATGGTPAVTATVTESATPTPVVSWTPTPGAQTPSATPTPPVAAFTETPTATHGAGDSGPLVTFLGIVRADGCRVGCFSTVCACAATPTPIFDSEGRVVFLAQGGGRGLLVIEGRPGASGFPVGSELVPGIPELRPDVQIVVNRPLGNGSTVVCDRGPGPPIGTGGGIPPVDPPDFGDPSQAVTDALNDFACRLAVQPSRGDACTLDNRGNFDFVDPRTTIQFCSQVASIAAFPSGDTLVTARLRDVGGNLGPPFEVIVRNPAGGPVPTPEP